MKKLRRAVLTLMSMMMAGCGLVAGTADATIAILSWAIPIALAAGGIALGIWWNKR